MPSTINPALTPLVSGPLDGQDFAYDLDEYGGGGSPFIATDANNTPLGARGFAGQAADLLRIEDSALNNLVSVGPTGVVKFGTALDTNLYRSAADTLKTDDNFVVGGGSIYGGSNGILNSPNHFDGAGRVRANLGGANAASMDINGLTMYGTAAAAGIVLASDTNLYRSAADTLKTDDKLIVTGTLERGSDGAAGWFQAYGNTVGSRITYGHTAEGGENNLGIRAGQIVFGSPYDTNLYRSAANQLKTDDDFYMSTNGSDTTNPRTFGFADLTNGEMARVQFGDAWTALQGGFDKCMTLAAYHSIRLHGNVRQQMNPGFTSGVDAMASVVIPTPRNILGLAVMGFSGQTADLQQWQDVNGVILTAVDAAGKLLFGASGAQDTNLYRSSTNELKTDDVFWAVGNIYSQGYVFAGHNTGNRVVLGYTGAAAGPGLSFGTDGTWDTNLYRGAANMLQTDDHFTISNATTPSLWLVEGAQKRQIWFDGGSWGVWDSVNSKNILVIDGEGVHGNGVISKDQIGVRARDDNGNAAKQWSFYANTDTLFAFWAGTISADAFQLSTTIADTETSMLVRRNLAGVYSLQRVSVGATDSGGSGFKVLRIPN